jgi:hypothetical protein
VDDAWADSSANDADHGIAEDDGHRSAADEAHLMGRLRVEHEEVMRARTDGALWLWIDRRAYGARRLRAASHCGCVA